MGLRRIKTTVNFDAPEVYHLYFGDRVGTPGTVMTHFPLPGRAARHARHRGGGACRLLHPARRGGGLGAPSRRP